jgi:ATP-binding cassette subfamily F protein uup
MKRKVLMAKALAAEPDVLLLDEPTNHTDIDSIKRLEEMLIKFTGALIFVTHDRMFLQRIATRIVEIDRCKLFDQVCDYETFLARRVAAREVEETQNALFDKKLKKEEQWIRTGVRARRTRNEGRVRELQKLRVIRRERKEVTGIVKIESQETERSGMLVVKTDNVSFHGYHERRQGWHTGPQRQRQDHSVAPSSRKPAAGLRQYTPGDEFTD